jgi:hypothetical protein
MAVNKENATAALEFQIILREQLEDYNSAKPYPLDLDSKDPKVQMPFSIFIAAISAIVARMPAVPVRENPNRVHLIVPCLWNLMKTIMTLPNSIEIGAIVIEDLERIQKNYHSDAPFSLPEILAELKIKISS